jgi:unsaturated pyranuronate lyase
MVRRSRIAPIAFRPLASTDSVGGPTIAEESVSTPTTPKAASFHHWDDVPKEQVNPDLSRRLVTGERVMVAQVDLERGCIVPQHAHVHEQVSYVLDGRLELTVGDETPETYELVAGDILVIPSNVPHAAVALENTRVIDVFSPPREDWINQTDAYLRR